SVEELDRLSLLTQFSNAQSISQEASIYRETSTSEETIKA
ncbi:MAG: hypothetical protein ACJA11_003543, partial [Glaciecola sp.]